MSSETPSWPADLNARYELLEEAVQVVAVGDRDQIVPLLTPFGPITHYDADGRVAK